MSDSDSSDYDSDSSGGAPGMLGAFMQHQERRKNDLTQFDGFEDGDDGTIVQKMKTIMSLRESLGMDQDTAFVAEQERRVAEKKKLAKMPAEERMQHEESQAGDVMAKIRQKHLQKQKDLEAKKKEAAAMEPEPEPESAVESPKATKKKKKKKPKEAETSKPGEATTDEKPKKKKKKKEKEVGDEGKSPKKSRAKKPKAKPSVEETPMPPVESGEVKKKKKKKKKTDSL